MRLVRRAAHSVLVVVVAATVSFVLLHVAPGDPISAMAGAANVSPETRAAWRKQHGYDRPIGEQYVRWLASVSQGDFGRSSSLNRPVSEVLIERLPRTAGLMTLALAASLLIGTALGSWQGVRLGSVGDRATSFASLMLYAIPEFLIGLALLRLLVLHWHWPLPVSGMFSVGTYEDLTPLGQLGDRAKHLILPTISLTLVGLAVFARYQRASMSESFRLPFVRTARAKGLDESLVRAQVRRNAYPPIVTIAGLFVPSLLTGAVFVERIYGWPGMGDALVGAITSRDYELVSACVILGSAMTALGSLLADVVRALIDPRLRAHLA